MSREILSDVDEKIASKVAPRKGEGVKKDSNKAQRRWRLLARALTRSPELSLDIEDEISVRRFTSFDLVKPSLIDNTLADPDSTWYDYRTILDHRIFVVEIRRINKKSFTANELMGFNNTGNVCVWPSEECLAYYLLNNPHICRNKMVLELGGGMSCLAGVYLAKYCEPAGVTLTDGNVTSVDNVRCIVARNNMADFVKCGVVQWARAAAAILRQNNAPNNPTSNRIQTRSMESIDESRRTEGLYDVILSADCLFFDEARLDLVETIYGWLADNGVALLMAPRRGTTFQKFAEAAVKRGFIARVTERYDPKVWSRHLELVESGQEYSPDLHYPILLELTKQAQISPG
ncbi:calmodulin-lysine N-methyltransferase [Venturia canescens]|uniref:calmodulin-lysine N-methyltransferase n=1 Tax=Venturia canescens TaxID=32260 RepID=UPI001C9BBF53|nr:calmodulin-lysine N-methyltransferase [Venturia canescens]